MVEKGLTHLVMEVSSHAIHQKRISGRDFTVGVFTNLSQDHLDYHETMEEYSQVKADLFRQLPQRGCCSDQFGRSVSEADGRGGILQSHWLLLAERGPAERENPLALAPEGMTLQMETPRLAGGGKAEPYRQL